MKDRKGIILAGRKWNQIIPTDPCHFKTNYASV